MVRILVATALAALITHSSPAMAVTAKQKMDTCKFGADDQKLKGAARNSFLSKCMANTDTPAKRAKPAPKVQ
jgi:psiF repeat